MLAVRRQHNSFGRGTLEFIRPQNRKVLAYVRAYGSEIILCVANLAQTAQAAELDLAAYKGRVPVELLGNNAFPPIGDLPYFLTLPAHAFYWFLLSDTAAAPAWHVERLAATELTVLVLPSGLSTLLAAGSSSTDRVARRTLTQLEQEVLPEFMRERRWFAAKGTKILRSVLTTSAVWRDATRQWLLSLVEVTLQDGEPQQYFLPLSLVADEDTDSGVLLSAEWTVAKGRTGARTATLVDAFADPAFCLAVARAIESSATLPFGDGELRFEPTSAYAELAAGGIEPVQHLGREQSNTSVVLGERLFLKGYRRSRAGVNPDMELPRYLTQVGFRSIPRLAGAVEYVSPQSPSVTLAALFAFVRNQGDGWTYALNHLERFAGTLVVESTPAVEAPHALFMTQMHTLGRRVGELHAALALDTNNADFRPEPIGSGDLGEWRDSILAEAALTFDLLQQHAAALPVTVQGKAQELAAQQQHVMKRIRDLTQGKVGAYKTRYHGDLHLGQVLLTADDFLITDFEGEPARSIEERRRKSSPLRDVAGMLRSFDYARAVALERAVALRPDLTERLGAAFEDWHRSARDAFLDGYRAGSRTARSVPKAADEFARLSDLFEIEKALYEVRYELANRPLWLLVPAQGLIALLSVS